MSHVVDVATTESASKIASAPTQRGHWRWLAAWLLLLAAISAIVRYAIDDRGVRNSVDYSAIGLAILGAAVWILRRRALSRPVRWGLAAMLLLAPASVMLQFSPVELIMDGNMTVVGWRWRWEEPDVRLAAPTVAKMQALRRAYRKGRGMTEILRATDGARFGMAQSLGREDSKRRRAGEQR